MTLTDNMRTAADELFTASFNHPFITELTTGNLPMDRFRFYLKQDAYYLKEFSRLHHLLALQLAEPADVKFLEAEANGLNNSEQDVRKEFFQQLQITADELTNTPMAPNTYNYVTHMEHELATNPAQGAAALLPCYWLYNQIGERLVQQSSPVKIYQQFIDTYASPEFTVATNTMIDIVDRLGEETSSVVQSAMITAFLRSSYFELNFWQTAYDETTWPF